MAEPDAAILFKTAHLAVVDGADVGSLGSGVIAGLSVADVGSGLLLVLGFLAIELRLVGVFAGQVTVFQQPSNGGIGPLEQLLAAFSPQRDLADKAGRGDIAGVPGSGGLGDDGIILGANVFVHFDVSL